MIGGGADLIVVGIELFKDIEEVHPHVTFLDADGDEGAEGGEILCQADSGNDLH